MRRLLDAYCDWLASVETRLRPVAIRHQETLLYMWAVAFGTSAIVAGFAIAKWWYGV